MKRFMVVVPLVFALVATACTSGGGNSNSRIARRRSDRAHDVDGLHAAPAQEPVVRVPVVQKMVNAYNASPERPRHDPIRQLRQRAPEADGGAPGQQGARRDLPVRHEPAAARDVAEGRRPDQPVNEADYNWNDFPAGERDVLRPSTARSSASPRSSTTWRSSTTRTCSQAAGLAEPEPDWTWDELVADAEGAHRHGQEPCSAWSCPIDGSETRSGSTSRCCGRPAATS